MVQEMNPKFPRVHLVINVYVERGRFDEAVADLERWSRDSGDSNDAGWIVATQAYVYSKSGQVAKGQAALAKLEKTATKQQVNTAALIFAHLGVGDKDATMRSLEKAYEQHSNAMTGLKVDPAYDPLRGDARFQELLRRVGLDN